MLNEGVLNLTLNESPEPKRSVIDPPAFEAGAGLRGACTGAGLRGAGAGTEIGRETAGLLLNLVEPEFDWTALDTTEEIWGEMLDTTWFTMSLELKVDEEPDVEVVSGGGARGATGRLLLLLTALDTVEEMRGWMLLTTVLTISLLKLDDPELNPLLLEELKPLLEVYLEILALMTFSSFTISAAKFLMPSASFSVAMGSSFIIHLNVFSLMSTFSISSAFEASASSFLST